MPTGAATKYRVASDPRLRVALASTSADGPWSLRATSLQAWTVQPVAFSVGVIRPLWLEVHYQTVDLVAARDFSCDGVF